QLPPTLLRARARSASGARDPSRGAHGRARTSWLSCACPDAVLLRHVTRSQALQFHDPLLELPRALLAHIYRTAGILDGDQRDVELAHDVQQVPTRPDAGGLGQRAEVADVAERPEHLAEGVSACFRPR